MLEQNIKQKEEVAVIVLLYQQNCLHIAMTAKTEQ